MSAVGGFHFDEAAHCYTLGGRRVPSVTQVINRIAPYAGGATEWHLRRGSAVHVAIDLALQEKLDWGTVDERIKGRVEAALNYLSDTGCRPKLIEVPLASLRHQFAGTVDIYTECGTIIDWKGSLSPQVDLQLGGYALLLEEASHATKFAVAVETHDDGTYKCWNVRGVTVRMAKQRFLSFLSVYNWLATYTPQKNTKI